MTKCIGDTNEQSYYSPVTGSKYILNKTTISFHLKGIYQCCNNMYALFYECTDRKIKGEKKHIYIY
jgi:hypothetical protein